MKFDHIGVVVKDLVVGRALIGETFCIESWTSEYHDPLQDVFAQFGRCSSGLCYEIIAPASAGSPVSRTLQERQNPLHHIGYLVEDLAQEEARLAAAGFVAAGPPKYGVVFDAPIQFFLSPVRLIVELIAAPAHQHRFA